ncbi:MAG TPA: exodeoxyribonuclease VII small subunit [Candidatus Limnocylindria bacterium]|nr:exodeoxyribonuclease VII small subunit [Candidatus Limnocylindria bacterium]
MTAKIDYAALSAELDALVAQLQSADLDVNEAVKAYERGMAIVKELDQYLKTAENKVIKVKAAWEGRDK